MLHKVIHQLDPEIFTKLKDDFTANRGEKMLQLLELYRAAKSEDEVSPKQLEINTSSFYTLKSRLQDKIQRALFANANDVYADLLKNLAGIPYIVNNTPRESAILLLDYLEDELKKADQPGELAQVYGALKRLHSRNEKYYHYEQLYNKNIAYFLAIEKAEEVLSHFCRECTIHCYTHGSTSEDVLRLYVKELNNLGRVYDSPRLKMYRYSAEITYALFVDANREIPGSDDTIEEALGKLSDIIEEHAEDMNYKYMRDIWAYLSYEYYTSLGLHKNATQYFDTLVENHFRVLYRTHRSNTTHILLSAFERIVADKALTKSVLGWIPEPDEQNQYARINIALFRAGVEFENGNFAAAASILNEALNDISTKAIFIAEYNLKLFLVLCLLCAEKTEQAEIQFRSISRKITSTENKEALHAGINEWMNLVKLVMSGKSADRKSKIVEAVEAANKSRKGACILLPHIKLKESTVTALSKLL
jgi:hypothetical protein